MRLAFHRETISLHETEGIAQERGPGDGTKQKWVLEQIENALAKGVEK